MTSKTSTIPTPISVSTSEACISSVQLVRDKKLTLPNRDNDEGVLWNTFIVEVRTPPQPGSNFYQNNRTHRIPIAAITGVAVSSLLLMLAIHSRNRQLLHRTGNPPRQSELDFNNTTFTELLTREEEEEHGEISSSIIHGHGIGSDDPAIKELPVPEA